MNLQRLARILKRAVKGLPLGAVESDVQRAVEWELRRFGVDFEAQPRVATPDGGYCIPDVLIGDIAVELKVGANGRHGMDDGSRAGRAQSQLANYLSVPEIHLAVLAHLDTETGALTLTRKTKTQAIVKPLPQMLAHLSPRALVTPSEVEHEPLSLTDYEKIKGVLPQYRDILLCKTLRTTGLRIAEVLRLTEAHFCNEPPDFYFLVKRGKKRLKTGTEPKYEKVYLPPQLGIELQHYIRGMHRGADKTIFGIKPRQCENIFAAAGRRAIGRPVHPHEFRHLYITYLIDNGLPYPAVSKMVGHASMETTMKVYYDLTGERRAEIQRRIPV